MWSPQQTRILFLIIALLFFGWLSAPIYGEICDQADNATNKNCPTYHVFLVGLWHLGKWLNYYGPAVSAFAATVAAVLTWRLWVSTHRLWIATDANATAAQDSAGAAFVSAMPILSPRILRTVLHPLAIQTEPFESKVDLVFENLGKTPGIIKSLRLDLVLNQDNNFTD